MDSTHASAKEFLPAYLVTGDDAHLADLAVAKLLDGVGETSINEFGPLDDLELILQALLTPSMFGDRRIVVVREVDKLPAESQRELTRYLESPAAADATLVLVGTKLSSQMLSAGRKTGHVVDAAKGKRSELLVWLKHQMVAKGLTPGGDALNALVEAVGEQRMALSQAVEELSLAIPKGGRVTAKQVSRQFQGRADVKLFGFIDAVADRQGAAALQSLHHLLGQGESVQMLFWTLTRHFRMLLVAADQPAAQVGKDLGIQPWRAEKLVKQARNFKPGVLLKAYQMLAEADVKMKKSEEPEGLTLEKAVVAISARS